MTKNYTFPFQQQIPAFDHHQAWIFQFGHQRKFLYKEKEVRLWSLQILKKRYLKLVIKLVIFSTIFGPSFFLKK